MSQATILKSTHSQRMTTPHQSREKNSQKEGNTLVIPSVNVRFLSFFFYCWTLCCVQSLQKDEQGVAPVLICKIRKGQELKVRCVAKKVSSLSCLSSLRFSSSHRVSQRSMQNGLLVPPSPLNTILTISFAIPPIGTKPISGLNGPSAIMPKRKNHHATMNLSIITPNPINSISKLRLTVVWCLRK